MDGALEMNTDMVAAFANELPIDTNHIAIVKADAPWKAIHIAEAAIIDKAASLLWEIHDGKLKMSFPDPVNAIHNEGGTSKGWVYNPKCFLAIGPKGIGPVGYALFIGGEEIP